MPKLARLAYSALALLCGSLIWSTSSAPASAAIIISQEPCNLHSICWDFDATDTIPIIRQIEFDAPKAGTAMVTFHGNLTCGGATSAGAPQQQHAQVRLVSQILRNQDADPDGSKEGGLMYHGAIFAPGREEDFGWADTFNLASTRVFAVKNPGIQTYYFKMKRIYQGPNIICSVDNPIFTVVFNVY
jgi:hypothetical protein